MAIHALLVGIDEYLPPVPKLRGCANDIMEMQEYLDARVDSGGRSLTEVLKVKTLIDREATRSAVIRAFSEHLGQAGPGDVALFCYSGHGSQEQAPEQFWTIEPDHLDETLVLYDSRMEGSWDLADKELSKLIAEVADKGPHVAVILDCCHSGSGTRARDLAETAVRRAPTDLRTRPPESFIVRLDELPMAGASRDLRNRPSGWNTAGRHVLLSACRDDEEAKEYQRGGVSHGAFSYFLGETLRNSGAITYRDLFARSAALVRGQVQRQSPQLEATVSEDLSRPFLGGAIRQCPRTFVASHQSGRWVIDAGRMHGIASSADGATELALFGFNVADADLNDPAKARGKARLSKVLGTTSEFEFVDGPIDPALAPLKAVVTHVPTPRLRVKLQGDRQGIEPGRNAIAGSQFVSEAGQQDGADFRLIARDDQYLIAKADDDRPVVEPIGGYGDASARQAVERLEHIERWKTTAELDNPASSIGTGEIQIEVCLNSKPLAGSEWRLEYTRIKDDEWINPEITIRLKNAGTRTLFVGLLDLPQTFGISSILAHVGCQKLDPGQETFANDGDAIPVTVPDQFWQRGVVEIKDIIKAIVSTSPFDARRLEQADLDVPRTRSADLQRNGIAGDSRELGSLERLMERVQTRQIGQQPVRRIDDWRTLEFAIVTVRPLPVQRLEPGRGVELTDGVRIEPHPSLVAAARLTSMPEATRATEPLATLPRLLYEDPSVTQPFEFAATRSARGVLNVLELSGVNDPTLVSAANPLRITIPLPLNTGECVLPVAFDGEFYLPLGRAESVGGETHVILERLPAPTEAESRSLGGSLRILFQKVIGRALGMTYQYPILACADVAEDFSVRYEADPIVVRTRVSDAKRVALFVHGVIGDTRDMAASLKRAGIADHYDLVLTFDYENLQDPIPETARALKRRLEAAGLDANHGKSFDIIAHSMGGLVSRWFIERDGGAQVVKRLFMLGTPNGGSPWPNVVDWATTALAVGLNELAKIAWPAAVLAGLTEATSWAQVTLREMMPDSELLRDLFRGEGPKIPYFVIRGDTSLLARTRDEERCSKLQRLLRRLWTDQTKYELANRLFTGADNDIAVSLSSMEHIPETGEQPSDVRTVACDHITYFRNPDALKALSQVL